jgi:hypothetical protein
MVTGAPRDPMSGDEQSMTWTWQLAGADGEALSTPTVPPHGNQSDAESWLGEHWRELADAGVASVTLMDGSTKVYGPMPLSE